MVYPSQPAGARLVRPINPPAKVPPPQRLLMKGFVTIRSAAIEGAKPLTRGFSAILGLVSKMDVELEKLKDYKLIGFEGEVRIYLAEKPNFLTRLARNYEHIGGPNFFESGKGRYLTVAQEATPILEAIRKIRANLGTAPENLNYAFLRREFAAIRDRADLIVEVLRHLREIEIVPPANLAAQ